MTQSGRLLVVGLACLLAACSEAHQLHYEPVISMTPGSLATLAKIEPETLVLPSPTPAPTGTNPALLQGYTSQRSYNPGDTVQVKVHCLRPTYHLSVKRYGREARVLAEVELPGKAQLLPHHVYEVGAGWQTSYSYTLPLDAESGMYAVKLEARDAPAAYAPFIVKEAVAGTAPIAVIASTNTWEAYNDFGGASFYTDTLDDAPPHKVAPIVSFERPIPTANLEATKGLNAGPQAERLLLGWLEAHRYRYAMLSDMDIHLHPALLAKYRTVILNVHGEYWSRAMVAGMTDYLDHGGRLVSLAGNSLYWKVDIQGQQMEVEKYGAPHTFVAETGGLWRNLGHPESALVGSRYDSSHPDRSYAPYRVVNPTHWIFLGTDVKLDEQIGVKGLTNGGASGGEMDQLDANSPKNVVLLAQGANPQLGADMLYYTRPGGGQVFSAGSNAFCNSLVVDAKLSRMLANVLDRFLTP